MRYYEINEETARRAHDMMSMGTYQEGRATKEYRASVDKAYSLAEMQKSKVSPFYHGRIDALLDSYSRRLAQWTNDRNRNGASCPSVLVCGPANFPTKKKARQNAREESLWREYKEISLILDKIKSIGVGPVDLKDPHAREILEGKLHEYQNRLESGKAMNAYYRNHKTMHGFPGMSDGSAAEMDTALAGSYTWAQKPMPDYEMSSLRGKVKRAQERLAELDRLQALQNESPSENAGAFEGGQIVRNAAENRLQILFDDIPGEEIRASLKSHGFRWSPKNKAWQRQLTSNAEYDAKRILGIS